MTWSEDDASSRESRRTDRAGNVIVVGPSRRIAAQLLGSGIVVSEVRGLAVPADTTANTRAVVVVVDDVEHALERATLVQAWAHQSVVPLIFVSDFDHQARDAALWSAGLCSLSLERDAERLRRLLSSLNTGRAGPPDDNDVELGFRLRMRLRNDDVEALGVGIDVFVANKTVFLTGLLAPGASVAMLTALLPPLGEHLLNTAGLV